MAVVTIELNSVDEMAEVVACIFVPSSVTGLIENSVTFG